MTFYEAFDEYNEKFPDGFPTIPLMNRGEAWCINVIEQCIHAGKDVYEMGYIEDDPDIEY